MTIQSRNETQASAIEEHLRPSNVVPLWLHHMRTPASIADWARTVELVLAVEPDPTVAMAWFANEAIAEFGGLTAYDMVCAGKNDPLDRFLRDIILGQRD
ncbi:hypothetical protein [Dyella silvae]|uniref:hypothetical protein n=1 Tax=Dyella silvae TaxID=2994424 RepID=UPI0022642D52|nr:hypothetical protein [Dyella silvae]